MKLHIETPVRSPDGEQIGTITKVVYDPQAGTVGEVVLDTTGLIGRQVLVPVAQLREDPGEVLTFDGDAEALDALPTYEVERYVSAPEGWTPDPNYMPGDILFPATTQVEMIPVWEESNAAAGTVEWSQDTEVACSDGRAGVVDQVLIDDVGGRMRGLVMRPDDETLPRLLVAPDLIAESDSLVVQLRCTLAELSAEATPYDDPQGEPEPEPLLPAS